MSNTVPFEKVQASWGILAKAHLGEGTAVGLFSHRPQQGRVPTGETVQSIRGTRAKVSGTGLSPETRVCVCVCVGHTAANQTTQGRRE